MAKVIEVNFNSGEVVDDEEDQAATKSRHPASNAGGTLPSTNNGITKSHGNGVVSKNRF